MVQWGPGPDALFMISMMKVHNIKPNYAAIAANMGDNFTNRALGHRMDALRAMADSYITTMAPQANCASETAALPAKRQRAAPAKGAFKNKTATTTTGNKQASGNVLKTTGAGVKKFRAAVVARGKVVKCVGGVGGKEMGKEEEEEDTKMKGIGEEGYDTEATVTDAGGDTECLDGSPIK